MYIIRHKVSSSLFNLFFFVVFVILYKLQFILFLFFSQLIEQTWQKAMKYQKKFKSCWCVKLVSFNPFFFIYHLFVHCWFYFLRFFFFLRKSKTNTAFNPYNNASTADGEQPVHLHWHIHKERRMVKSDIVDKCNFYLPISVSRSTRSKWKQNTREQSLK